MIKTAVILAAGLGSRLKEHTTDKPKGFLCLEALPIIEESIQKCISVGIERIIIGTGYKESFFIELSKKYPQITCVSNSNYSTTGSMGTFALLKNDIQTDFILLESDLIYEKQALWETIDHIEKNVVLSSDITNFGDEVFIQTNTLGYLETMDKDRSSLTVDSVLVGINKVSLNTYQTMVTNYEKATEHQKENQLHYEDLLVRVGKTAPIYVHKVPSLLWMEIDDEDHLSRAKTEVYPAIQKKDHHSKVKRNVLLNPGPATTTDSVKYAQVHADICPRELEFGNLCEWISNEITTMVSTTDKASTILMGGSGTAAVESMLSSIVHDGCVLIINNGAYGKRLVEIATIHNIDFIEFKSSPTQKIDLNLLKETVVNTPNCKFLSYIHHETTTGLLNNTKELGNFAKEHNLITVVDAMSSFAAIPIDLEKETIHFLAASSNKNLQGMAGIGIVICQNKELEKLKNKTKRSLYLDLYNQYENFQKSKQFRFTPPVQTLYALRQAIIETNSETIEARYNRYSKNWETLINGLSKLKLETIVEPQCHGKLITAIKDPEIKNYTFDSLHHYCKREGFTIYPGKVGNLNTFRIANIGTLTPKDISQFIKCLATYLSALENGRI
jgi:2-aminoethylphosphonate-pyruvate transaminase